jgi:site-specific DNA recombinase
MSRISELALFKHSRASFITLREQFDTTTAAGEMMVFNLINFAQFERKQTAERISANGLSRAKRGLWNGGTIPLGFDRNPKNPGELVPNAIESKQVKQIFELFLQIGSVRKTCLELTKRGIFSKKFTNKHGVERGGGHMTVMSLQRILTNKAYIGVREFNYGKTETVKASWAPIVGEDVFEQVQKKLSLNKNKHKPDEWKTYSFPLTELLVCGECGKNLGGKSGHGRNGKHFYYGHPRQLHSDGVTHTKRCQLENVRTPKIEEIVLKSLKGLLEEPGLMDHWLSIYAKRTSSELPGLEAKLKTLGADIQVVERKIANLVARLSDLPAEISAEPIYLQMKDLNSKLATLIEAKERLESEKRQISTQAIDRDQLRLKIKRTIESLENAPADLKRPIYANMIKFAELYPTKIRMGVFAPTESATTLKTRKASVSGSLLNYRHRAGSCTVSFGAQDRT